MTGLRAAATVTAGDLVVRAELSVAPGETVAVLGPNGSGKTTIVRALAGLTPLSAGTVELDGRTLEDVDARIVVPPEERSVGVVFQELLLFDALDVVDNVAFGLRARGARRDEARATGTAWLEQLGLTHLERARVSQLSGGEAQRVALARALAAGPRALLLDEPLAALDVSVRADVRRHLRDHLALHGGPCVLVTHDPLDAAVLADRVVVLEAGEITDRGTLADLVARPRTPWAAELAGTNLLPAVAGPEGLTLTTGALLTCTERALAGRSLVAIRPASITLHRARPEGSARNVWPATVLEIEGFGERSRVRLGGVVPVVAEVTAAAVLDLGLAAGTEVWASVKATDVAAYPA